MLTRACKLLANRLSCRGGTQATSNCVRGCGLPTKRCRTSVALMRVATQRKAQLTLGLKVNGPPPTWHTRLRQQLPQLRRTHQHHAGANQLCHGQHHAGTCPLTRRRDLCRVVSCPQNKQLPLPQASPKVKLSSAASARRPRPLPFLTVPQNCRSARH